MESKDRGTAPPGVDPVDQAGGVVFVGAVHEAGPALQALLQGRARVLAVFTQTLEQARHTAGAIDLESLARRYGVPVHRVENLNAPEAVQLVQGLRPDLMVVVGWTRLLGEPLLALPRRGCVGFHASLLPRHRGRAPVNWAILRGETETGNTMMYLAPGADTGDIIDQQQVPITADDTCATVYARIAAAGAHMLTEHLPALLAGTAPRRRQPEAGDLLPRRTPEMGITDWDRPAAALHDWVRALTHPYPGAFTFLGRHRLHLWTARLPGDEDPAWKPEPGTLMGLAGDAVRVRARGGSLLLARIQQEHEAEESAAAWFVRKGRRRGDRFTPVEPAEARRALGLPPEDEKGVQA